MNTKIYTHIIICCLLSAITILILWIAYGKRERPQGGFTRLYHSHQLKLVQKANIGHSYYLAGVTPQSIYLAKYTSHRHILVMNHSLTDTTRIKLKLPNARISGSLIAIDSPFFYLMEGNAPTILNGKLSDYKASLSPLNIPRFSKSVPISPTSSILTTYDTILQQRVVTKVMLHSPNIQKASQILEKQLDGLFCTDGMFQYNPQLSRLIYVYYYRNQFICMDTNLNVIYRNNTIDTTNKVQIRVAEIQSKIKSNMKTVTLSKPPLMVNKNFCTSDSLLFVHSNLMADNDDEKLFKQSSIVDVYSINNGKYKFSFHISDNEGRKIKSFRVFRNKLFVTIHHSIIMYNINF